MTLKTATGVVIVSLTVGLVINLAQWAVFTFRLLDFSHESIQKLFQGVGLLSTLIHAVPLLIFFMVLNAKQKGTPHE